MSTKFKKRKQTPSGPSVLDLLQTKRTKNESCSKGIFYYISHINYVIKFKQEHNAGIPRATTHVSDVTNSPITINSEADLGGAWEVSRF